MPTSIPLSTLEKFNTFGDLLRFLRRRAGITQIELAVAVGYSDAQISRLEQNLRLPDIPTIEARFVPALDLEDEPEVTNRLLELAANVRREDAPSLGICPYKGLSHYDEADADLFVGREALTEKLTGRILSSASSTTQGMLRFLAVVGASGSGKSSLVRAGLVPALRWNKATGNWTIHVLTPTADPLAGLAMTLNQENGSIASAAALMDDFSRDARSLHMFGGHEVANRTNSRLLLVVDQFEELFTLCRSEEQRAAFIDNLLTAAREPGGSTVVIITLRADFYAHCAGYLTLREALANQQEYIGAMSDSEMQRAIEEPARRGRWELEPGLVELLLRDVGHEPGALPLLSHALMETWQKRQRRTLTFSGYIASGGVHGAIAETAEAVFADQFTKDQKMIARRIFLRLTELGDDTATGNTRRRARLDELILKPEDQLTTLEVLKALADARLITTSENSVEVAHEALIREWPTLRGWLEDNREELRLHRHLTETAQEWAGHDWEPGILYRGARLVQALEWAASHGDELNALELEFLAASQVMVERETAERESHRLRELETARKLAEAEQRRAEEQSHAAGQVRRRSTYLAGALVLALVMVLIASILGWQARMANLAALSRELAAAALGSLESDPERSILLALEALSTTYTLEAEDALHQSILASRVRHTLPIAVPGSSTSVAFSPDGHQLAAASPDGVVKVWDLTSDALLFALAGHSVTYDPAGKQLVTVTSDGTVELWNSATGERIQQAGHIDAIDQAEFSPDGTHLATVTSGNLPRIWDVGSGRELVNFPGHTDYVSRASFSSDGDRLLTAGDDGSARVWSTNTGEQLLSLSDHPGWVWNATFSPDGLTVATISENEAVIWDAATGEEVLRLPDHQEALYAVAFSPDGRWLATGGQDRKVRIWDAASGKELFALAGHTGVISDLAFSPDGTSLASGSDDGFARIWDLSPAREWLALENSAGKGAEMALNPDGQSLAAVENDTVKVWNAATGRVLRAMSGITEAVSALQFSPDGRHLAAAGDDMWVKVWDVFSGTELSKWIAHTGGINALAFSQDGTRLATASNDYKVKIWDASWLTNVSSAPPRMSITFDLPAPAKSVAFNADGTKLAAGTQTETVKVWDLSSQKLLFTLRDHLSAVVALAFSPDGNRLASAGEDGIIKIWDMASGQERSTLTRHRSAVVDVAFNPDGTRLASAGQDGQAIIWDTESGRELLTFYGDGSRLNNIAFSPDGNRLVTGSDTGMRVYLLNISELVALAHTRVTRALTSAECQEYLHGTSNNCPDATSIPTPTSLPPVANGRICQVTSTGGLYDGFFNELIYKGLQASARYYGLEANVLQSTSLSDYEQNLRLFAKSNCSLIVVAGLLVEATQAAAESNPEQKYVLIDFMTEDPLQNVMTQLYATDQAAFLAGYVAASVTKSGKVGVFGGVDLPQVTDFMDGFALGVDYYNQKNGTAVEVVGWDVQQHAGLFAGGFCCTTEGRQMAQQLLAQGVDVILPVAGESVGWGAGAAVQEHGDALFIGVDTDWTVTAPEFADIVLTSIEKRYDVSVVLAAKSMVDGKFSGEILTGTLETGEVGISPFHSLDTLVSGKVKTDLEQIKAQIIAGEISTKP